MAQELSAHIDERATCIAAAGYGRLPLAVAVSGLYGLRLTMVRDTEKNHGRGGMIDGYTPTALNSISVVDNVFTSGSSLRETLATVRKTGASVISCHVVIARGDTRNFELPVSYIFAPDDLR